MEGEVRSPLKVIKSPLKAIKLFCQECVGGKGKEVLECKYEACPLYPFRMGKNPYITFTEDRKAMMKERVAEYWKKKKENA